MSETKNPGEKTLSVASTKGTLTLKRGVEQGVVRQSFSHGRTKAVVVENYDSIDGISIKEMELPAIAAGQVRVRIGAAAVGFVDGLKVQGLYQTKDPLPFVRPGAGVRRDEQEAQLSLLGRLNRLSGIAFGERSGEMTERARAIEAAFASTPVSAPANPNILQEMWEKFVMMGAMAGMNCLMRGTVGEIVATQDGSALMSAVLGECEAVAAAAGFAPRSQSRARVEAMLTEPGSVNSASMRHDLEAGRRTEADAIVGDLVRRAAGFGIATPLLRAAWCHLQVHENRLAAQR